MTLDQLRDETLVEKNRRLKQARCKHGPVYSSSVSGPDGCYSTSFCLDCGKSWKKSDA